MFTIDCEINWSIVKQPVRKSVRFMECSLSKKIKCLAMKPIYSTGDKVYLTEEDDFVDYEIVEISAVEGNDSQKPNEKYKYKIRPVKGDKTLVKSESEIFPITFA